MGAWLGQKVSEVNMLIQMWVVRERELRCEGEVRNWQTWPALWSLEWDQGRNYVTLLRS
jgi:hypothetical protein